MKGTITISSPCNNGDRYVLIRVADDESISSFLNVKIQYEYFTSALMGLAEVPIDFCLSNPERVGKQRESKIVSVLVPKEFHYTERDKAALDIAKKFEVDGWIMSKYLGCKSSYTRKEDDLWANVSFYRWV